MYLLEGLAGFIHGFRVDLAHFPRGPAHQQRVRHVVILLRGREVKENSRLAPVFLQLFARLFRAQGGGSRGAVAWKRKKVKV